MSVPVSIVIASYNRERYLPATIESVLAQTWKDFELLIWDDGSTDRSVEIAKMYAAQDKRVRVIPSIHQGVTATLRSAIASTSGKYIGCVDSDDLIRPQALADTIKILDENPKVGYVYTDYEVMDAGGKVRQYGSRCKIPYSRDRLLLDFMTFHFRLMRRTVYDKVGGIDDTLPCTWDYDICLKMSEVADVFHHPKPLYLYRVHPDSISQDRRVDQILTTKEIITRAIHRRGMADKYELNVQIVGKFSLKKKNGKPQSQENIITSAEKEPEHEKV